MWKLAEENQQLVIVSIGYSTCHWCHVMEKECFEDVPTAELMNAHFLCIKVDREERPDVDQIYMDACQVMTGRGGWPLNVICLPNRIPIFAGTYFPKERWQDILRELKTIWHTDRQKVLNYSEQVKNGLVEINRNEFRQFPRFTRKESAKIVKKLSESFDLTHGGLKRHQKFPLPVVYEYLLDEYLVSGNREILDFVNLSLLKMCNSAIHDHLRGGFYRYATDSQWFAPHFEKMLYDNAQMLSLYSRAFSVTGAEIYKQTAIGIYHFIQSELAAEKGGYYSALDADSEGIEGRYYVFTDLELQEILTEDEFEFAAVVYNFKPGGNWEHGFNILHKTLSPAEILEDLKISAVEFVANLNSVNKKLKAFQDKRIRPGLDNKIICSWNGLLLSGMASAGLYLNNREILSEAEQLGEWMIQNLWINNELKRTHSTRYPIPGFSEDYACTAQGFLSMYEATGHEKWLNYAADIIEKLIADFYDSEKQAFYFVSKNSKELIAKKMDFSDDVIPATNSIMSIVLQKMGILSGKQDWLETGKSLLYRIRGQILEHPEWYCNWARAAQTESVGMIQVACTGKAGAQRMFNILPNYPSWAVRAFESKYPSKFIAAKMSKPDQYFICINETCFEPVNSDEKAMEILEDLLTSQ